MADAVSAPELTAKDMTESEGKMIAAKSKSSRVTMRRQSYGFRRVSGVKPLERASLTGMEFKRPIATYLPTYQLNSHNPFKIAQVKDIMDITVDEFFDRKQVYNAATSPSQCLQIAGELMRRIKSMNYDRYRIIAVVTIGQKRAQSYNNTISFIWDSERDMYVDIQREMTTVFLQATVFGVYLD